MYGVVEEGDSLLTILNERPLTVRVEKDFPEFSTSRQYILTILDTMASAACTSTEAQTSNLSPHRYGTSSTPSPTTTPSSTASRRSPRVLSRCRTPTGNQGRYPFVASQTNLIVDIDCRMAPANFGCTNTNPVTDFEHANTTVP